MNDQPVRMAASLPSEQRICHLPTGCRLEPSANKGLGQLADGSRQMAGERCQLTLNPEPTGDCGGFSDGGGTHSPFGRGEPPAGEALHPGEGMLRARGLPVILCLDLGTTTGWALHSAQGVITSGTTRFKNDRWQGGGMRFLKFTRFLGDLESQAGPIRMVFFEEVRRHLGVDAAHAYGGFMAHLTAWCEHQGIAYEGVPVGTIKRHATGKGNASKAMMLASARQRGHWPADDNEADALALAYWAVEHRLGGA